MIFNSTKLYSELSSQEYLKYRYLIISITTCIDKKIRNKLYLYNQKRSVSLGLNYLKSLLENIFLNSANFPSMPYKLYLPLT